jgi:malate synthase
MTAPLTKTGLIDKQLFDFINDEVLPQLDLQAQTFWQQLDNLIGDFAPYNHQLLQKRRELKQKLVSWQVNHPHTRADVKSCNGYLKEIGFLAEQGPDFTIKTENVDKEITDMAGPQMVVPGKNARFALNASNARWGSLYDALYGTDAIAQTAGLKVGKKHNQARGNKVIQFAKNFLDETFPLDQGSHQDVTSYLVYYHQLLAMFDDGTSTGLKDPSQFVALCGHKEQPTDIVLKNNGLHVVLEIDRNGMNGCRDLSGINDIQIESALTTIVDFAEGPTTSSDKLQVYRNWCGLMQGDLHAEFDKDGEHIERKLLTDKRFTCKDGDDYPLPGRTLLIARNADLADSTSLLQDREGNDIPESILDSVMTALMAMLDKGRNSRCGSIYVIKPQLQGPEEVEFSCKLFNAIEQMLGLEHNTIKLGLMDDSPRTTVNLKECIRKADERLFLLNTELSLRHGEQQRLFDNWNIDMGIACGLSGKAQIGRGMWSEQKQMAKMLEHKIKDVQSGANCAWVPCPSAATLHALHYHKVDAFEMRKDKQAMKVEPTQQLQTMALLHI